MSTPYSPSPSPADQRQWIMAGTDTADVLPRSACARGAFPLVLGTRRPAAASQWCLLVRHAICRSAAAASCCQRSSYLHGCVVREGRGAVALQLCSEAPLLLDRPPACLTALRSRPSRRLCRDVPPRRRLPEVRPELVDAGIALLDVGAATTGPLRTADRRALLWPRVYI